MSNGIRPSGPGTVSTPATIDETTPAQTTSESQQPQENAPSDPPVRSNANEMRKELGFFGQMRELVLRDALPGENTPPLLNTPVMQAAPSGDATAMRMKTLPGEMEKANVPKNVRDDLLAQLQSKSGADLKQALDQADKALKSKDAAGEVKSLVIQGKVDSYFQSFNQTYEVNGKQVKATPHFRMTNGASGPAGRTEFSQVRADLQKLMQTHDKGKPRAEQLWNKEMHEAVKFVAGGKPSAEQLKMVTDALIKTGKFEEAKKKHPGLSDAETIRMMQWDNGVGIDCAGYVSQAFVGVHGGTRGKYGLQQVNNESLMYLKGNANFTQVKPQDIKPGDLIALDKPTRDSVGHTVLVRNHHIATPEERNSFVHAESGFEKRGDKIHVYEVDASWGAGQEGKLSGGLQRRIWLFNETTGKWGEATPDIDGELEVTISSANGPYNHPMNGIYRPK